MAAQILHLPIAAPCHVAYRTFPFPRQRPEFRSHAAKEKPHYVRLPPPALAAPTAAAEGGANGASDGGTALSVDYGTTGEIKDALCEALEGINRGIFGASSAKKKEIEGFVELLESRNPTPCPTDNLAKVDGCWKLVYSTISILGSKRTKLGLRDFITLGDFLQTIDVAQGKAINEIKFNGRGFKMLSGQLSIVASYEIASKTRVDIKFENSDIAPDQLMDLFQKNYDLLLGIFNPDGWLEITYVDESMRIGRDDKGNIFILERLKQDED